ncbi:MAG: haloalkane dehalogenase [Actinobacteria bacterium]|nr:MAG: haloalkane dehalogenase [Actinomycetota bacterium]REK33548.1 MAG: haloalkane dehalogenase [Actinomycetota bacterium]
MRFNPKKKSRVNVLGVPMAYVEAGKGDPIVFIHGNPTSSYLWRKVIPEVAKLGRCVAPDLIGMGDSAKIGTGPNTYRFVDHRQYLEGFLDVLDIERNVTLVGHDWGGPLAFDWGRRHPDSVKAVVYMETIVTPIDWDDWPDSAVRIFKGMRSEAGEEMVLNKNVFVERILPGSVLAPLSDETMAEYRRPYTDPGESRRPTLTWPREIPIEGEPSDVDEIVRLNQKWLESSSLPKLMIDADPGSIMTGRIREVARTFPNQTEVTVKGSHFVQEDSGPEIGQAIADFIRGL